MSEYQQVRMQVSHGPDLHFDGKVIGEYTTQNKAGTKQRWTELRLWETPAGNWIAESVGCSSRENEGEIRAARAIEPVTFSYQNREEALEDEPDVERRMITGVMDLFEWTTAAKAFAKSMGWNVTRRVD